MYTSDLYWEIESLYSQGKNAKQISDELKCDVQIVYEVLKDLGVDGTMHRPRRGKITTKMRDDAGY